MIFNKIKWHPTKLIQHILLRILIYNRVKWVIFCYVQKNQLLYSFKTSTIFHAILVLLWYLFHNDR